MAATSATTAAAVAHAREFAGQAQAFVQEDPWATALVGLALVVLVLWWRSRGAAPSYGSGANPIWNRYVVTSPPQPREGSEPIARGWTFDSPGADPVRPSGESRDKSSGLPLTNHLVGRMTWRRVPPRAREPATDRPTFEPASNTNPADKPLRTQQLRVNGAPYGDVSAERGSKARDNVQEALRDAIRYAGNVQVDSGFWAGDYGGPFFLLPGLVFTCYIAGFDLGEDRKEAMMTYLRNHQQRDGGWPLHLEGPSTMFGSVLNYVAMRLLGLSPDDSVAVRARAFIHQHKGATYIPSWGKLWLAVLGLFEWEGVNPIPPELWMLPNWCPFHPGRMWCHARMVYLPMSWLYGTRSSAPVGAIQHELRRELFPEGYENIHWNSCRNRVCPIDLYSPHTALIDFLHEILVVYEKCPSRWLRRSGVEFAAEYMHAEDLQTNYVDIGPVNKVFNMLCAFFLHGKESDQFRRHAARIDDYLYVSEDGMKMQGYNGSQLWDTAFMTQAIVSTGLATEFQGVLRKAHHYIDVSQIRDDVPMRERFYREISKGGWPFSTSDHGWPIADCTAEGLKAALELRELGIVNIPIEPERFFDAVNLLLVFQNEDGGWATYERNRGYNWYEWLNPAEVFGDIMIDYSYTELTSAVITALCLFRKQFPFHRPAEVNHAIQRGVDFVRLQQRDDGSFYGSWAICFTYGTWFGTAALLAGGEPQESPRFKNAAAFLLSHQRSDGGWGESYLSCVLKTYTETESTAFQTAWALLALVNAQCDDVPAVERAVRFLLRRQRANGDWPQESVAGIFNRTCGISYSNYRNIFPIWALGAYATRYRFAAPGLVGAARGGDLRRRGALEDRE